MLQSLQIEIEIHVIDNNMLGAKIQKIKQIFQTKRGTVRM